MRAESTSVQWLVPASERSFLALLGKLALIIRTFEARSDHVKMLELRLSEAQRGTMIVCDA